MQFLPREVQVLLVASLLGPGKRFALQYPRRPVSGALAVRAQRKIPGGQEVLAPRRCDRLAAEAEHVQWAEAMANLKLCLRGHLILDSGQSKTDAEPVFLHDTGQNGFSTAIDPRSASKPDRTPGGVTELFHGGENLFQRNRRERRGIVGYAVGDNK